MNQQTNPLMAFPSVLKSNVKQYSTDFNTACNLK